MAATPFDQLSTLSCVHAALKEAEKERDEMREQIVYLGSLSCERAAQLAELEIMNKELTEKLHESLKRESGIDDDAIFSRIAERAEASLGELERLATYSLPDIPEEEELELLFQQIGDVVKAEESKAVAQAEVSRLACQLAEADTQLGKLRSLVSELEASSETMQKRLSNMNAERLAAQRDAFERTRAAKEIELSCQREVERLRLELMKQNRTI